MTVNVLRIHEGNTSKETWKTFTKNNAEKAARTYLDDDYEDYNDNLLSIDDVEKNGNVIMLGIDIDLEPYHMIVYVKQ